MIKPSGCRNKLMNIARRWRLACSIGLIRLFFLAGAGALAAAPAAEGDKFKIGYVNLKALMDEAAITAKAEKAYQREKKDIITTRERLKEEVLRQVESLKLEREFLKKKDFEVRAKEIQKKADELNEEIRKVNNQLEKLEKEKKLEVFLDISEAIDGVAASQGYDLILNRRNAVIYGESGLDITDQVLEILTEINQRDHPNAK